MKKEDIPTPTELIEATWKDYSAEADAVIARLVAKLRANPQGRATEVATHLEVLRVVEGRMRARGWVCEVFPGSQREPDAAITVTAPTMRAGVER